MRMSIAGRRSFFCITQKITYVFRSIKIEIPIFALYDGRVWQTIINYRIRIFNAVPVILGEIKKLFRDGGTVKVSRSLKELSLRINAAREHHSKLCGAEPTLSQLAEELGESVENITLAIQAAQPAMSLTPENREESDRQIDIPVESPEEELADKIGLAEVLKSLPEEDRLIIQIGRAHV